METQYSLRPGIALIDFDKTSALFYRFGNRVIINGLPERFATESFFEFLHQPRTISSIQDFLRSSAVESTSSLIQKLDDAGLLQTTNEETPPIENTPWNRYITRFFSSRSEQFRAAKALQETPVRLLSLTEKNNLAFEQSLHSLAHNFSVVDAEAPTSDQTLTIVRATSHDILKISRLNKLFLKQKKKWLLCTTDEYGGSVGPYFGFKNGPCYDCLISRRNLNLPQADKQTLIENYFDRNKIDFAHSTLPNAEKLMAEFLTIEVFKILTDALPTNTVHGLYEFDFINFRNTFHDVLALPYCQSCSQYDELPPTHLNTEPK